ncbi:MAG: 50S ribosomal protein L29 [Candidatus Diapherotrites archaeon]|nr:50S ribosomal protein L29 [Candidatus Diapherotrites archaeon]
MSKAMKNLRAFSKEELFTKILEFKAKLAVLRGKVKSNIRPDKPGEIRVIRRNIARIMTLLNSKTLAKPIGGQKLK